jgi:putative sigma-54 modulation protein
MQIEIRTRDVAVTETMRTHIERRLDFALGRFAERIRRVRVTLGDLNGPKGGIGKKCQVIIWTIPPRTIVMEDQDSNIYAAIDRVADKVGTSVGRQRKRPHASSPSWETTESGVGHPAAGRMKTMKAQRKKVLVADCHEEVLIALEKVLEDAGFDTTTVWTAKDALRLLDSQGFDLMLVNEYLPDAECEDLLKALRQRAADIPCIVMQPSAPEITDFTAFQALGAREIVCKYAYRHIVEVVSECLVCVKKTTLVA